ncbi:HutP family protein [Lutibacter sp. B2]|nr:HutP family protein [Lutibacter sp. B2]
MKKGSLDVARACAEIAMTSSRSAEEKKVEELKEMGIKTVAVDVGGNLIDSIPKIIERAIIASRRSGLIKEAHVYDGAVAGAAREAIMQVAMKANGLNVGGKIGVARCEEHLSVCIFMSIGLLHLNEVVIAVAHRSVPNEY